MHSARSNPPTPHCSPPQPGPASPQPDGSPDGSPQHPRPQPPTGNPPGRPTDPASGKAPGQTVEVSRPTLCRSESRSCRSGHVSVLVVRGACLSRGTGESPHARFLGGSDAVTRRSYPTTPPGSDDQRDCFVAGQSFATAPWQGCRSDSRPGHRTRTAHRPRPVAPPRPQSTSTAPATRGCVMSVSWCCAAVREDMPWI
jgi:hypothetical protein